MTTETLTALSRKSLRRTKRGTIQRRDLRAAAVFLAPFIFALLIFQYLPLGIMARDSMYNYTLYNPDLRQFVGFDNFTKVFTDPDTVQSLLVTLAFAVGVVVLIVPLSFLLAVFLNGKLTARNLVRTMVFLPVVTSSVVVAVMWNFMLSSTGLVNSLLNSWGLPSQPFLTDTSQALPSIIVMTVWQQIGLATVFFLGGLQAIPTDVMEAAAIDGAGFWRRTLSVLIPMLSPTTLLVVVVMTVFSLQAFAPAYIMTSGGPEGTTNLVIYQIYKTAFLLQQPGFASAIAVVVLVFSLAISLVQMRLLRSRFSY